MEYTARGTNLRVSPTKLIPVVDTVRGKNAQQAIDHLSFCERRWAEPVLRIIRSAVSNAAQNRGVDVDRLYIKKIVVDKAFTFKRFMTRARGGSSKILKRNSHLTVVLEQKEQGKGKK